MGLYEYKSFAKTIIGGSHIKHGKDCEDASGNYDKPGVSIAVVADGHGDDRCFRSGKGAEFAVECAIEGIRAFVEDSKTEDHKNKYNYWFFKKLLDDHSKEGLPVVRLTEWVTYMSELEKSNKTGFEKIMEWFGVGEKEPAPEDIFTIDEFENDLKERLIKNVIRSWQKKVADDYEKNPFTPEELEKTDEKHRKEFEGLDKVQTSLTSAISQDNSISKAYGTTLIAAAITKDYWFGIHIGDGRFTALYAEADKKYEQPVPWDEKCHFGGVTTSICDDDAYERARCYFSFHGEKPAPVAVFLCTDGVDDSYPVNENAKYLFRLYRTIAIAFAEEGFDSTCDHLKDVVDKFATKGKGDDTSIAGFIDMELLKKAVPLWEKQIAEEEAEDAAEKAAKDATEKAAAEVKAAKAEEKAAAEAKAAKDAAEKAAAEAKAAKDAAEKAAAEAKAAKDAAEKAATETRANDEERREAAIERKVLEEIAAIKKQIDLSKNKILDYGRFVPENQGTEKPENEKGKP